jgi:hypothetical protein
MVEGLDDPIPVEFVREFQASTIHVPVPGAFFERLVVESSKAPARVWRDSFRKLSTLVRPIGAPAKLVARRIVVAVGRTPRTRLGCG